MGLEFRGGRTYFYAKHREGSRVFSRYVGAGALALGAALLDAEARRELDRKRAAGAEALDRLRALTRELRAAHRELEARSAALLAEAGFHRPGRGVWRKKRVRRA